MFLRNVFYFFKVSRVFTAMDSNQDSAVSLSEFQKFLPNLGLQLNAEEAAAAFRDVDRDSSGVISFGELALWLARTCNPDG